MHLKKSFEKSIFLARNLWKKKLKNKYFFGREVLQIFLTIHEKSKIFDQEEILKNWVYRLLSYDLCCFWFCLWYFTRSPPSPTIRCYTYTHIQISQQNVFFLTRFQPSSKVPLPLPFFKQDSLGGAPSQKKCGEQT